MLLPFSLNHYHTGEMLAGALLGGDSAIPLRQPWVHMRSWARATDPNARSDAHKASWPKLPKNTLCPAAVISTCILSNIVLVCGKQSLLCSPCVSNKLLHSPIKSSGFITILCLKFISVPLLSTLLACVLACSLWRERECVLSSEG